MRDTSIEIYKRQLAIHLAKSDGDRIIAGLQMMEDGRAILASNIAEQNPGINDIELKIEVIKRLYKKDFTIEEMNNIINHFKQQLNHTL